jgi:hypothetical protein
MYRFETEKEAEIKGYTHFSLWNLRLCTTSGFFCEKFHRWMESSAVAVTSAPSFVMN